MGFDVIVGELIFKSLVEDGMPATMSRPVALIVMILLVRIIILIVVTVIALWSYSQIPM